MNVVVFLGPSLRVDEAKELLDATYLPPASQGDVMRATLARPWAIALIDGYFERMPSVWHKELLWAMTCGIHVYGASSMGALRAAELAPFGMEGEGEVFQAFRDGRLEDDDEVAVMHGPAAVGYMPGSDALVNIRATLRRARDEAVIGATTHDTLVAIAKALFYPERTHERVLATAPDEGVSDVECSALRAWLPSGRVDVKCSDARALLTRIASDARKSLPPKRVTYRFQRTLFWEKLRASVEEQPAHAHPGLERVAEADQLDELRLLGSAYALHRERAFTRLMLTHFGEGTTRGHSTNSDEDLAAFRAARGLEQDDQMQCWLTANGMTEDELRLLASEEARLCALRQVRHPDLLMHLRTTLRVNGQYAALASRARHKTSMLARWGLDAPRLADARTTEEALWRWYFETHLGECVPDDLATYARQLDCVDVDQLRRIALRERLYTDRLASAGPGGIL